MSNSFSDNLTLSQNQNPEMIAHMPESFQMMIRIQQEAEAEFKAIVADIEAGRTTLEAVKVARGLA
jgi:hypothetical protein